MPGTASAASRGLLERVGFDHPVVQAPMAGGATTAALVGAVCEAGGLGSLAAAISPPQKILDDVAAVRAITGRPFNVNLFVLAEPDANDPVVAAAIERAASLLAPLRRDLGLAERHVPEKFCERPADQLAALREAAPAVASFTFGLVDAVEVRSLKKRGCFVIGTATNVAEARAWEEAGADAVCAQGAEAGAHRGTFIGHAEDSLIGTVALVPRITDAVRVPVIAAGGIVDGRGVAAALCLGADAAQIGTAFLACPEAGINAEWKRLLQGPEAERTVVTRAFTGRHARGIANTYTERMHAHQDEVPPYPVMNAMTGDLRAAAGKANRPEYLSLWAGQGAPLRRALPAGDLVARIVAELADASGALARG